MTTLRLLSCWALGLLVAQGALSAEPSDAELRACGHGQEREVSGGRGPALALNTITPADASYVTPRTMVVAELKYDIDKFEPGMYQLLAQFKNVDSRASTSGMYSQHPELQYAHGVIRFCYPLRSIWDSPIAQWPLELVFNLVRRNDDGSSTLVAQAPVTRFNSHATPLLAVTRAPPTADQVARREAVETLYSFFESTAGQTEACSDAFPAMKARLQPPLDAWRARYAALREKTDNLFLQLLRQRTPGISPEGVRVTLEARRTVLRQVLQQTPEALSERNCRLMPGRFADGTYDPAQRHPQAYALLNE